MEVRITHRPNLGALHALVASRTGGVARDMYRRGQNVWSRAVRLAGADTGRLRSSISVNLVPRNGAWAARVGTSVEDAPAHNEGYGGLGPVG